MHLIVIINLLEKIFMYCSVHSIIKNEMSSKNFLKLFLMCSVRCTCIIIIIITLVEIVHLCMRLCSTVLL